jgi:hypothetical protein
MPRHLLSGAPLLLAPALLAVRVVYGLDFGDEMQYYGQILALVTSGRLFSADLFLQQNVYLLVYPLFAAHFAAFGTTALVLVGRLLLAGLCLGVFFGVRRILDRGGFDRVASSWCALAILFAVPYHNIFALSYNTAAQLCLALGFALFLVWGRSPGPLPAPVWAAILVVLGASHPTLGLAILTLVLLRLAVEREYRAPSKLLLWGSALGASVAILMLRFATPRDYAGSVEFTRRFGVGTGLGDGEALRFLAATWALAAIGLIAGPGLVRRARASTGWARVSTGVTAAVAIALTAAALVALPERPAYGSQFAASCVLAAAGLLLATAATPAERVPALRWHVAMFFVVGTTMALTSGNGLAQFFGAAMMAAPFFAVLPIAEDRASVPGPARLFGVALPVVYAVVWLAHPYLDAPLWRLSGSGDAAPAYRYLRISPEKEALLAWARDALSEVPPGARVLVVGPHPWIYFAIDARPDTEMLYLHPYGATEAYELIARRLESRRPAYVIVAGEVPLPVDRAVTRMLAEGRYSCRPRQVDPALVAAAAKQNHYALLPEVRLCARPGIAP